MNEPITRGLSIDLVGHRFGRLIVQHRYGKDGNGNVLWACWCDCGNTTVSRTAALTRGQTSCSKWCGHVSAQPNRIRPCRRKPVQSPVAVELADVWKAVAA